MTKEEIFEAWAPPGGRWSPWVKPVMFSFMNQAPPTNSQESGEADTDWLPHMADDAALVLDLPGPQSVWLGVALAGRGYRPVPLYNAVPGPAATTFVSTGPWLAPTSNYLSASLVDVGPILSALWYETPRLLSMVLGPEAPPAFLLDANRRGNSGIVAPGRFDNRSISFTTDFPSATYLAARGIRRALLIQLGSDDPQPDLAHTLRRWQDGGIIIELKRLDVVAPAFPIQVRRPSGFGLLWYRALRIFGLRRHALGGFGGFVPEPSAG